MTVEVSVDGFVEVLEHGSLLLGACGDHRPSAFAPSLAVPTTGGLGDAPVDDHEACGLFRQMVGRFDARCGDEAEVGIAVEAKMPG